MTRIWRVLRRQTFTFGLAGLLLLGCFSRPSREPSLDWNTRIGNYTYQQAMTDLGPPDIVGESAEGKTAEWILNRSPGVVFGLGMGSGVYGPRSGLALGMGQSVSPRVRGDYLRLIFGPDGKLVAWSRVHR